MKKEIENAQITGVTISMADHNCLTFRIYLKGAGFMCGIGNYRIGIGMEGADYWEGNGSALVGMMKIMDTVGVSTWEGLERMYCRISYAEDGKTVQKIGHLLHDKWFDVREFFQQDDGHAIYVLDERSEEDDEDDDEFHTIQDVYDRDGDDYFR